MILCASIHKLLHNSIDKSMDKIVTSNTVSYQILGTVQIIRYLKCSMIAFYSLFHK